MVHQNQKMNPMPHMYIDNGQIAKMYAERVLLEKISIHLRQTVSI